MPLTSGCLRFPEAVAKNSSLSHFTVIPSFMLLVVFFEEDLEDLCNFSATAQDLISGRVTSL